MTVFILKRELRTGQRMTKLPEHWTTLALCPALQSLQTAVLDPETYNTIFSTSHLLGLDMSIHQDKIKKKWIIIVYNIYSCQNSSHNGLHLPFEKVVFKVKQISYENYILKINIFR